MRKILRKIGTPAEWFGGFALAGMFGLLWVLWCLRTGQPVI